MFTLILTLFYIGIFHFSYDRRYSKIVEIKNNYYINNMSSYRAGGSGIVLNKDGTISNAIEPEECLQRANNAENVSDYKIKRKAFYDVFFDLIFLPVIIICIGFFEFKYFI